MWPVKGKIILKYGKIKPGLHNDGINIAASNGEDVVASRQGKIIYAGNEIPGYGNLILIKHDKKWMTIDKNPSLLSPLGSLIVSFWGPIVI